MNFYNVTMICKPTKSRHTYEVEATSWANAVVIMRRKFPANVWAIGAIKKVEE
jgi:hypothetical protein